MARQLSFIVVFIHIIYCISLPYFVCRDSVDVPAAFADMINLEILNFFNNNIEV